MGNKKKKIVRDVSLLLRLSKKEKQQVENDAEKAQMTVNSYIRAKLFGRDALYED